jgi:hypothetical protein
MVPVVVSAGLAVGVFAGLLFGLGTGEDEAHAGRRIGSGSGPIAPVIDISTEEYDGTEKAKPVALAPDAGPPDAAPVTPAVVEPAIKIARLTLVIVPPGVSTKVTVDGNPVDGEVEIDITAGTKTVDLVVKAAGFRDFKKKIPVYGDDTLTIELSKQRPVGTVGPGPVRTPKPKSDKIDI